MKRFTIVMTLALIFNACSNLEITESESVTNPEREFASILSEAVVKEPELRVFLKNEASKQFDKDFDVFYPWAKDTYINEHYTFEETLEKYDKNNHLQEITRKLPKLTILIPDWSWLGGFSITEWDTTCDDIAVGYACENSEISLFHDGILLGSLAENEITEFPVMFIKENERMKTIRTTKSSKNSYDFADSTFNNIFTKLSWDEYYSDELFEYEMPNNYVKQSELDQVTLDAFEEFGDELQYNQRDYIFYGLTKLNNTGRYCPRYKEYLYKICFEDALCKGLTETGDGSFVNEYSNKGKQKSNSDLKKLDFRIDGNLELHFNVIACTATGSQASCKFVKSVRMSDLFNYNKVKIEKRDKNVLVWRNKYVYTIDENCLVPKWYIVNQPLPWPTGCCWDLAGQTCSVLINVQEYDDGTTSSYSVTLTSSTAQNVSTESTSSNSGNSIKAGYGNTTSQTYAETYSISSTNNTDNLGDIVINYCDNIIKKRNETGEYEIAKYSTGTIKMMIFPRRF